MIRISLDDSSVAVGEIVSGQVFWTAEDDRAAREIIISAQWRTAGEGNCARGVARTIRFTPRPDQRFAEVPFRLLIPHEGPVSFKGELITMIWILCVQVNRLGFDEQSETEFRVSPRRRL